MKKEIIKQRAISFFATSRGRQIVFYASGIATAGLFLVNWVPHTYGLKFYQDFVQCYQSGVARPVPQTVLDRLEDAYETLALSDIDRQIIKPFSVFGFDLFTAGATKYRSGGLLGIPVNYSYSNVAEINRADIMFRNEPITWSSDAGKLLQEAIVLDEDEKAFGLMHQILQLQSHRVLLNSIFPTISFLSMYTLGRYFNIRLNLFARPFSLRLVLYTILGCFGLGSWCFMKDFNQVSYDAEADKRLSELGPRYVEAGLRFYDKLLKKNIALRELIGDNTYTALGNVNYTLRQKHMPLTARKAFFEKKLKELQGAANSNESINQSKNLSESSYLAQ